MKRWLLPFIFIAGFALSFWPNGFRAQEPGPPQASSTPVVRKPIFVSPEQFDFTKLLPAPPADNSPAGQAALAELHRIEQTRTPEQIARAQADDKEESIFIFKNILGDKFKRDALPATALLSDHLKNDEGVNVKAAKNYFRIARPYHRDPTLKPVCKMTDNRTDFAYPSGHATTGYLEGLVLSMLVPEKKDAIMARADEYAHNRAICGVHYPHDAAASKVMATAMFKLIQEHPQFKEELARATAELRHALGLAEL